MGHVLKSSGTPPDARTLARKLAWYLFLPCIVFSALAVFVGLANWEVEGPGFFAWSMVALAASAWLFRAARRGSGRVLLYSGGAIVLCCAVFAALLAWFGFTRNPNAFGAIVYFVIAGGFGVALVKAGAALAREAARERAEAEARNPMAELGSAPGREGDRV